MPSCSLEHNHAQTLWLRWRQHTVANLSTLHRCGFLAVTLMACKHARSLVGRLLVKQGEHHQPSTCSHPYTFTPTVVPPRLPRGPIVPGMPRIPRHGSTIALLVTVFFKRLLLSFCAVCGVRQLLFTCKSCQQSPLSSAFSTPRTRRHRQPAADIRQHRTTKSCHRTLHRLYQHWQLKYPYTGIWGLSQF